MRIISLMKYIATNSVTPELIRLKMNYFDILIHQKILKK